MKKHMYTLLLHLLALGGTSLLAGNRPAMAQDCRSSKIDFGAEKQLDLHRFYKDKGEADNLSACFKDYVRYSPDPSGPVLSPVAITPVTINMKAIVALYRIAANQAQGQANCGSPVTGLRITLGMQQEKIVYFYQPVFMCYNSNQPGFEVNADVVAPYYRYNPADQSFIIEPDANEVQNRLNEYYRNIYIDHFKNGNFTGFRAQEGHWKGDTRSIIFSFQEIFGLYHNNYTETDDNRYCQDIIIEQAAANYRRHPLNRYRLKHTLYIKTNGNDQVLYAANLAHLCPPSCNFLRYDF